MARGLFIEPFYGGSHRAFADGLGAHSRHQLELLTLPGGEWRRRMRTGAEELARLLPANGPKFDFLVATDMLDLPLFLGLARRRFAGVPVLVYFHENQFTYPRLKGTKLNSWFGAINYHSALVADMVAFNSAYHRDEFLAALRALAAEPNNWLEPARIDAIAAKSGVLPVGVHLPAHPIAHRPWPAESPLIAWNACWEFDKSPDLFARTIRWLDEQGLPFRLALCGDPGPNPHPALTALARDLSERVVHAGLAESREAYLAILARAHIVVSTARHEFFGVGLVEAMHLGCIPLAPARLNYPALVPTALHDLCLYADEAALRTKLRTLLESARQGAAALAPAGPARAAFQRSAARFGWSRAASAWDAALDSLATFKFDALPAGDPPA